MLDGDSAYGVLGCIYNVLDFVRRKKSVSRGIYLVSSSGILGVLERFIEDCLRYYLYTL